LMFDFFDFFIFFCYNSIASTLLFMY